MSLASSIICFIISASFGEAVVVAGAETTGLVTVVGGTLGCEAGVCAEAMEVIKAIATRAISAEMMRVFMRMILPAGSMASNKKAKREAPRVSGYWIVQGDAGKSVVRRQCSMAKSKLSLLR